jgi:hypothetical protein
MGGITFCQRKVVVARDAADVAPDLRYSSGVVGPTCQLACLN